jgi:hypothetical protein
VPVWLRRRRATGFRAIWWYAGAELSHVAELALVFSQRYELGLLLLLAAVSVNVTQRAKRDTGLNLVGVVCCERVW